MARSPLVDLHWARTASLSSSLISSFSVRVHEGVFEMDVRHGKGKAILNNGDVMEGQYHEGKAHGAVKITFATGKVSYATFMHGQRRYVTVPAMWPCTGRRPVGWAAWGARASFSPHPLLPPSLPLVQDVDHWPCIGPDPRRGG